MTSPCVTFLFPHTCFHYLSPHSGYYSHFHSSISSPPSYWHPPFSLSLSRSVFSGAQWHSKHAFPFSTAFFQPCSIHCQNTGQWDLAPLLIKHSLIKTSHNQPKHIPPRTYLTNSQVRNSVWEDDYHVLTSVNALTGQMKPSTSPSARWQCAQQP